MKAKVKNYVIELKITTNPNYVEEGKYLQSATKSSVFTNHQAKKE